MLYYQKSLYIFESGEIVYEDNFHTSMKATRNWSIGKCYYGLENYYSSITYIKKAINLWCDYLNVSIQDIQNGKVQDEGLGLFLYDYAWCYYKLNNNGDGDEIMKLSALCGNDIAIRFCNEYSIKYQTKSNKLFE